MKKNTRKTRRVKGGPFVKKGKETMPPCKRKKKKTRRQASRVHDQPGHLNTQKGKGNRWVQSPPGGGRSKNGCQRG